VTGQVMQKLKFHVCNNVAYESKYVTDIDNIYNLSDLRNFFMVPLFGKAKKKVIGILQLINNSTGKIKDYDEVKENNNPIEESVRSS
jgi:hypothetical protein